MKNMKKILLTTLASIGLSQTAYAGGGDDPLRSMLLMERLELLNNNKNTRVWDGSLYIGYDMDKLYFYSAGEATSKGLERSQNDFVYSHAIAPFWDIQIGMGYDKNTNASKTWGEIAVSGLAPYWFKTRISLLLSNNGNTGLRFNTSYDALLTQKLILTPLLEADFYTQDDSIMQTGSGLSSVEAGLRLRYEIKREFAPYIGLTWTKTFGTTRQYNPVDNANVVMGIRFWF